MRIKNLRITLLLITLVAGSVSCKKLLDVPPQGKLTLDQFWLSEDQAIAAIGGIYSNLGSTKSTTSKGLSAVECFIYWGEMRADQLASNSSKLPTGQEAKANMDLLLPAATDITTNYTSLYRIINFANQAIKNIPPIVTKDPAFTVQDMDQLTGEAYFLRAYAYFWLVRAFRDVPLVLDPSETDQQNFNVAKSTDDSVLSRIIIDLETAKRTLPEWYTNSQYSRSRATKHTAEMVLADVYLWKAATSSGSANKNILYDKAIENLNAVINSRRYFMVPGVNFGSIYLVGNSDETIFETYANSKLNNQVNDLKSWFATYFLVTTLTDNLFTAYTSPDYRGFAPPAGPTPPAASKVSYDPSTRFILKYNSSTNDPRWIFYRYPDVLLMKAEALAHRYVDDPVQLKVACDLVNEVRYRAYGITSFPIVSATTTLQMDDIILDERGREFIGEGKRWFDLMRFASRDNYAHKEFLIDRVLNSFTGVNQLIIDPRVKDPLSWYLPLNADALAANPQLVQNPYYQ
ncbi:MAG TPA: RagB/SusD family nutrient uptake outer membrane protein [Chitinophagaceae bacterium]